MAKPDQEAVPAGECILMRGYVIGGTGWVATGADADKETRLVWKRNAEKRRKRKAFWDAYKAKHPPKLNSLFSDRAIIVMAEIALLLWALSLLRY